MQQIFTLRNAKEAKAAAAAAEHKRAYEAKKAAEAAKWKEASKGKRKREMAMRGMDEAKKARKAVSTKLGAASQE
jgi:hypothetical protein